MKYLISVDTGGTFTDVVILNENGEVYVGKAPSTPRDFSHGILNAISDAQNNMSIAESELYQNTQLICHGTTVATNSLLQHKGARTGLLITKGFEDTLAFGRMIARTYELAENEVTNFQKQQSPATIVPRELTAGVKERIDYKGMVICPLDLQDVQQRVKELVNAGIEALAVCLLWSFRNPRHEQMIKELVLQYWPGLYVTISSDLVPMIREYERANTTAINCFVGPVLSEYLRRLENRLGEKQFSGQLLIMQTIGGLCPAQEVVEASATTIYSGPVGGVLGAQKLGEILGEGNILTTDMGGTSFDVGLIVDGLSQSVGTSIIGKFVTMVPGIEVVSIGAGGGSIAWIDDPPALRVGPQSSGAEPGPACYGLGGGLPTVTDVDVVLGYINPHNFLGGRIKLDHDRAWEAIRIHVADRLGMSVIEAAAGIYDIVNAHMADLIRKVSIERGYDPREFTLFAFGGAAGAHCVAYATDVEAKRVIIPQLPAVFSAFGIARCDMRHFYAASQHIVLGQNADSIELDLINSSFRDLTDKATRQSRREGVEDGLLLERSLDIRYVGQVFELPVPLPWLGNLTHDNLKEIRAIFEREYERAYGYGAVTEKAAIEVLTFRGDAITPTVFNTPLRSYPDNEPNPASALTGQRQVYWGETKTFSNTSIYTGERLTTGNIVKGPAVIEFTNSTVVLPSDQRLCVDEYLNLVISLEHTQTG